MQKSNYNINSSIEYIIEDLDLNKSRAKQIKCFLKTVSEYKLNKYIKFVKNSPDFVKMLKIKIKEENLKKDNWDIVILLYHLNIKLSTSVYPYIYIFETALKTKINQYMSETHGQNWISHNKKYLSTYTKINISELKNYKNDQEFIENETTLGFWTATLQFKPFWCDEKQGIYLKNLFNKEFNDFQQKKLFANLESIRRLRNKIAHFDDILINLIFNRKINQISENELVEKLVRSYDVGAVYRNILELYKDLTNNDIKLIMNNLYPYLEPFEDLYKDFEDSFNYETHIKLLAL